MNAHTDREEGNCGRGTIPTFHVKFEKEKNKLLIFQIGMTEPVRKKQNFARMTDKREPLYLYYTFRNIYISYFSSAYFVFKCLWINFFRLMSFIFAGFFCFR